MLRFVRLVLGSLVTLAAVLFLLVAQLGHACYPNTVAVMVFQPGTSSLLVVHSDGTADVWDHQPEQPAHEYLFSGHRDTIRSIKFSPDNRQILTCGVDGTARLWDSHTGAQLRIFRIPSQSEVSAVEFVPNSTEIITGSTDGALRIWDTQTGFITRTLPSQDHVGSNIALFPDAKHVAAVYTSGYIRIWNIQTGVLENAWSGSAYKPDAGVITSIDVSSDGKTVATSSVDDTVRLWDAQSGQPLQKLDGFVSIVSRVKFSPDGKTFLVATLEQYGLSLWNSDTGTKIYDFSLDVALANDAFIGVNFSPDGKQFTAITASGITESWDTQTGKILAWWAFQGDSPINSAGFSTDGRSALAYGDGAALSVVDATSGKILLNLGGHTYNVSDAVYSPDGTTLLTVSPDTTMRLWDDRTNRPLNAIKDKYKIWSVAYSPDGNTYVVGTEHNTTILYSVGTGQPIRTFKGHTDSVFGVAFSPDGKQLVTAGRDGIAIQWDVESGQAIHTFVGHYSPLSRAIFSPDGKQILTSGRDGTARLWDAATGNLLHVFSGHADSVSDTAMSPDGKYIVTGSRDKTARLWDAKTGDTIYTLDQFSDVVTSVKFSPDGKRIITGTNDGVVREWDIATGQPAGWDCPPALNQPWKNMGNMLSLAVLGLMLVFVGRRFSRPITTRT